MSCSSGKRKFEEEAAESAKKVKQTETKEKAAMDNSNMASSSISDQGCDTNVSEDSDVPPGIKLLFTNLSQDIHTSYVKLEKRLDNLEKDLEGKITELISVAISKQK